MQAVILAGGKGTRLHPYTTVFPKPLVPVGDRPILEVIVRQLRSFGYTELVFAVNHLAELIQAYFGDGSKWGLRIRYSREEVPIGTAGPLSLVPDLDDHFLVMNGDILTTLDYGDLLRSHRQSQALATIATCVKQVPISLGVLDISPAGQLLDYTEKPTLSYPVSMGVYGLSRDIVSYIPPGLRFDFPDLMLRLINEAVPVTCYAFDGIWYDIGRPEDCQEAIDAIEGPNRAAFGIDVELAR